MPDYTGSIDLNTPIKRVRLKAFTIGRNRIRVTLDTPLEWERFEFNFYHIYYPVEGTVEYDNLTILQQMYARPEGFVNALGERVEIEFSTDIPSLNIDDIDDYGSYNPLIKGSLENHLARLLAQAGGSPRSGLSHEYESLAEIAVGVRQVPSSKWFDGIHYDGTGGNRLRFQSATDHVHIEGGHIDYFVYNSSNDKELYIENHQGVQETVVRPQHSVDIRIVEEHEGSGSLIVYNEGTYHRDLDESDIGESRWQSVLDWGKEGLDDIQRSSYDPLASSVLKEAYAGLIYNTVFVSTNKSNLSDDAIWSAISQNLIYWNDFINSANLSSITSFMITNSESFYLSDRVLVYSNGLLAIIREPGSSFGFNPPAYGTSPYRVRRGLGYTQDIDVDDATLSELHAIITGIGVVPLNVDFDPAVLDYSATVGVDSLEIRGTASSTYAIVSGDVGTMNLVVGENIFRVTVTSESYRATQTYTLTLTRTGS